MTDTAIAIVDCGAESGRVMLARCQQHEGQKGVFLTEVHRFPTKHIAEQETLANGDTSEALYWDWDHQTEQIETGLKKAAEQAHIVAIGVDTWGVDFGLLNKAGELIRFPRCYRDPRGERGGAILDDHSSEAKRYGRSGIAQLSFNSLNQLAAQVVEEPQLSESIDKILFLPDLINHHLCGIAAAERCIAATSSCFTPGTRALDSEFLKALDINPEWFAPLTASGTTLGPVTPALSAKLGLPADCVIVASAGHDTSAAIAALPNAQQGSVYLSSGTWSLVGMLIPEANVTADAMHGELSNEGHWDGSVRLNHHVMGLWILQQYRKAMIEAQGNDNGLDYGSIVIAAEAAEAAKALDVHDQRLLAPHSANNPMPARLQQWFAEQGHDIAIDQIGIIARSIFEGLAHAYAEAIKHLSLTTGIKATELVILGGGSRNQLLNKLSEEACGIPVRTGATESTALGNALITAQAAGIIPRSEVSDWAVVH